QGLSSLDGLHLETPSLSALELNELYLVFNKSNLNLFKLHPQYDSYPQFDSSDHGQSTAIELPQSIMNYSTQGPSTVTHDLPALFI
ncbi:hypothetical protein DFH28DRAFT_880317, partial [Melampsora americana]